MRVVMLRSLPIIGLAVLCWAVEAARADDLPGVEAATAELQAVWGASGPFPQLCQDSDQVCVFFKTYCQHSDEGKVCSTVALKGANHWYCQGEGTTCWTGTTTPCTTVCEERCINSVCTSGYPKTNAGSYNICSTKATGRI